MTLYLSTTALKQTQMGSLVKTLMEKGVLHIELTGGTEHYPSLESDLLSIKANSQSSFLLHNYFPPPQDHFVLNLASLDEDIYSRTLDHYRKALSLAQQLGASIFALHAGFLIPITTQEIGQKITEKKLQPFEDSWERFKLGYTTLQNEFPDITIYVENNVLSQSNMDSFNGQNPFMLTHFEDYLRLKNELDFTPLLDVGHLKVSCQSLGLDFEKECALFMAKTDYVHLSDNDGLHDINLPITKGSALFNLLKTFDWSNRTVTLEITDSLDSVLECYNLLKGELT